MFLFRRRNVAPETKAGPAKKEAPAGPVKKSLPEKTVNAEPPVKMNEIKKSPLKEGIVKVVIPAVDLEQEDASGDVPELLLASDRETIPDEVADKLLVKVHRPETEQDEAEGDRPEDRIKDILKPPENMEQVSLSLAAAPSEKPAPVPSPGEKAVPENPKTLEQAFSQPVNDSPKPDSENDGKGKSEKDGKGNLFSSLFGASTELEETPVDRLIKSLPDVTIKEVLIGADEVKRLMNEWYQNHDKSDIIH